MDNELVSIIVPVYNVEKYLDKCIDSIVNQTYNDIEIILVNDGSTDSSYDICMGWSKVDDRIRVLSQTNQGQGPARNYGVREAKGDWIAFVDSDDWVAKDYVGLMMEAIYRENADMAKCNFTQIRVKSGDEKTTNFYQTIGVDRDEECIIAESGCTIWNLIIRKSILHENGIEQPNCKWEDCAVGLEMCLLAKKIAFVNKSLYFYRKERVGSTTGGVISKRHELVTKAMPWLLSGLRRCGLNEKHTHVIRRYIAYVLTSALWGGWLNLTLEKYHQLRTLFYDSYEEILVVPNKVIATFGSWNLTETVKKMPFVQDMDYTFHFSSIISLMNPCNREISFHHKNVYRAKMIRKDIDSVLWDMLEENRPDCFVFDLLEERNDIEKFSVGCITKSVALSQAETDYQDGVVLKFGSAEWKGMWEQMFDVFAKKLQEYVPIEKIIMVRHFLSERHGDVFQSLEYTNIEEIRRINAILSDCYQYASEKLPDCTVIDLSHDEKYITDERYEYGVEPYYINSYINEKVGELIVEEIGN